MNLLLILFSLILYSELNRQAECSTALQRENVINFVKGRSPPLVRPDGEGGGNTPVVVNIKYSNIRILDVDEQSGTLKTTGYLYMTWTDRRLGYERLMSYRGDHLNVTSVRVDTDSIWTPDIELYNADTPGMQTLTEMRLAVLMPPGNLIYVPSVAFTSFCEPVSENQSMTCTLRLGSWTYSVNDVDLQVGEEVDLTDSSPKGQWRLTSSSVQLVVNTFACCPEGYVTAVYTFNFTRQQDMN